MTLTACTLPTNSTLRLSTPVPAAVTQIIVPAVTQVPPTTVSNPFTALPSPISATAIPASLDICTDPQAATLLASFKTAILTSDGALLGLLVSPTHGMDARYLQRGNWVSRQQLIDHLYASTPEYNRLWAQPINWSWTRRDLHDWAEKKSSGLC